MKLRMRIFSFCMMIAVVFGLTLTPSISSYAEAKAFSTGERMDGLILQFFIQDDSNHGYKWFTYDQAIPIYGQTMQINMTAVGTEKFTGASEGVDRLGFQLGDGNMEIDETVALHYRLDNIVFKFANHEDFTLKKVYDEEVLWKCKSVSWGKDGNSTAIYLNDEFEVQFPGESFLSIANDLVGISCNLTLDYYEYGATEARKAAVALTDKVIAAMGTGVNISGALDAPACTGDEITEQMIDAYKALGYNAIRIPVCFDNHMNSEYKIDSAFMNKVKDVVAMVTSKNMYAILALESVGGWADPSDDNASMGKKHLVKVWSDIADAFMTYDEYLSFEILNKPKSASSALATTALNQNLSDWYGAVVAAIRATGGNNLSRPIILDAYASLANNVSAITIPSDKNIIVSIAVNAPYDFTTSVGGVNPSVEWNSAEKIGDIRSVFSMVNKAVGEQNVPAIISEYGATDKDNYQARVNYAYDFVKLAKEFGYVCFWNDNGTIKKETAGSFGLINRSDATAAFPSIAEAAVAAAAGKSLPALKEGTLPESYVTIEETDAPTQEITDATQASAEQEQPQKNKKLIVIVAIVAAVLLLGSVVVLMVVFKKRNGSFI